jgi:hypothetical protein
MRIVEADVTAGFTLNDSSDFAIVAVTQEIVTATWLVAGRKIQRQYEVRYAHTVDFIIFILHRVAHSNQWKLRRR